MGFDSDFIHSIEEAAEVLLQTARSALEQAVGAGRVPPPHDLPCTSPLDELCGVFVTLRCGGRLRGCIGLPEPVMPIIEAVWVAAQQSALEDPRFPGVVDKELKDLTVEVSILTPSTPLEDEHDLVLGRDGVVLAVEGHRALYLPEVATETGWGLEEFLSNLALKAGLPADAWRWPGAQMWKFETVKVEGPALVAGEG